MSVEIPLAFTPPQRPSPANDRNNINWGEDVLDEGSDNVQLINRFGPRTQGASELEKAIGVHAVDQATLERDIALEVLQLKYPM